MTDNELKIIATKWFEAFNQHNLEKLLALYSEDAEHYSPKLKVRSPETQGFIKGKLALRSWWRDSFDRLPSLTYEIIRLLPHDSTIFMEYNRHVDNEEALRVGETLEVRDGLIIRSRVYHS